MGHRPPSGRCRIRETCDLWGVFDWGQALSERSAPRRPRMRSDADRLRSVPVFRLPIPAPATLQPRGASRMPQSNRSHDGSDEIRVCPAVCEQAALHVGGAGSNPPSRTPVAMSSSDSIPRHINHGETR